MSRLVKVNKEERRFFTGTFENTVKRYDYRKKRSFEYVRITDVIDEYGIHNCNHAEFNILKSFSDLHLQPGDKIILRARPVECEEEVDNIFEYYSKDHKIYNRLMNPTKVQKLHCPVQSIKSDNGYCKIQIRPTR